MSSTISISAYRTLLLTLGISAFFSLAQVCAHCQSLQNTWSGHASLESEKDSKIRLAVTGAWPLVQILNRLRREYGWIVDYEEGPQSKSLLEKRADGRLSPKLRTLSVLIQKPAPGSLREEKNTLDELATALNTGGSDPCQVTTGGTDDRFDLVPLQNNSIPLLSTVIKINAMNRSAEGTIDIILSALQSATGHSVQRGGIADPGLINTQISVGGSFPARVLLAEALDSLPSRHIWNLTYDPSSSSYILAIETAVKAVKMPSGTTIVGLVRAGQSQVARPVSRP